MLNWKLKNNEQNIAKHLFEVWSHLREFAKTLNFLVMVPKVAEHNCEQNYVTGFVQRKKNEATSRNTNHTHRKNNNII